jgi:formylmethanofuran dehydrogenase subunit E
MENEMEKYEIKLKVIGVVEETGGVSVIRIFEEYSEGLKGIHDNQRLMVLFWMHLQDNEESRRRLSSRSRHGEGKVIGVFSSHSPHRPNPIGVTIVELVSVEACKIFVKGLDAFENTPILDIKSA